MRPWMIVEDEPDIYDVVLAMFEIWGIEGIAFVDGREAVSWVDDVDQGSYGSDDLPEIAILDIRLPEVNGPEVGARIRRSSRLAHIPIVLITAYHLGPDGEEQVTSVAQADRLMYKPLPPMPELRQALDEVILKRKMIADSLARDMDKKPSSRSSGLIRSSRDSSPVFPAVARLQQSGGLSEAVSSSLPTHAKDLNRNSSSEQYNTATNNITVLIIQSSETEGLTNSLRALGCKVKSTSAIKMLRQRLANYQPDAVIINNMANAGRIRALISDFYPTSHLPAVITVEAGNSFSNRQKLLESTTEIDAICLDAPEEIAAALATVLTKQPALPAGKGIKWRVLVASQDLDQVQHVTRVVNGIYDSIVDAASTVKAALEKVSSQHHLILFEARLIMDDIRSDDVIKVLQSKAPRAVVILLARNEDKLGELNRNYSHNIREVLPLPFRAEILAKTLNGLKKWRRPATDLHECWAKYSSKLLDLEYEIKLRTSDPDRAAMISEFGAITGPSGGIIHDIRGTITSPTYNHRLLEYAQLLLECIASVRFNKASWSPQLQGQTTATSVETLLHTAFDLCTTALPKTTVTCVGSDKDVVFIADLKQMIHSIAALCIGISVATHAERLELHFSTTKHWIRIAVDLKTWEHGDFQDMLLGFARKIVNQHHGNLVMAGGSATLAFPVGGWPADEILHMKIAQMANREERLRKQRDGLPQLSLGRTVAPLIGATAEKLVSILSEFDQILAIEKGEPNQRNRLRFTMLLARNLQCIDNSKVPNLRTISVSKLWENVDAICSSELANCEKNVSIPEDIPSVLADELGLMQVFVNLIKNAVEAMHDEGTLTVRAESIEDCVYIHISDTGHGISPENLNRIYLLSFSTKSGHERGVGLYVVATLMKQMNGIIKVDSRLGEGTTFTLVLPSGA